MDKKETKFKVGDKVDTKEGKVEVTAVNDDGTYQCSCVETGTRKVCTEAELEAKK